MNAYITTWWLVLGISCVPYLAFAESAEPKKPDRTFQELRQLAQTRGMSARIKAIVKKSYPILPSYTSVVQDLSHFIETNNIPIRIEEMDIQNQILSAYKEVREEQKDRIQVVLDQSIFNEKPKSLIKNHITTYDPSLVAVTATMYSQLPERDDTQFSQHRLIYTGQPQTTPCPYDMRFFIQHSSNDSPWTFVILPGAYASWESGMFHNQTIATLNDRFDNPTIIALDGYLSPAFLQNGTCHEIPWDAKAIALDIRERLKRALDAINADPKKTGLIGYSGGGGLILPMLAEDAKEAKGLSGEKSSKHSRLFGLGGMAFSPTLHGLSIFNNIDASVKDIPHEKTLISSDISYLVFIAKAYLEDFVLDWRDMVDLYEVDPQNYRERFFNTFTYVDLKNVLSAMNFDPENVNGDLSYYNVFVNTGLRNDMFLRGQGLSSSVLAQRFEEILDPVPMLKTIDRPLLIYFSQDDPVLSSYDGSGQPQAVTEILNHARQNPNITVFNPEYGGHTGQFFDPIFEPLLHTFFTNGK